MARKFVSADPTANTAIGNVTKQNKIRAPREKAKRKIAAEYPEIFAGLNPAQAATITLAACRISGARDAWDITADHLEQAKSEYIRSGQ